MTRASAWLAAVLVEAEASSVTWYSIGLAHSWGCNGVVGVPTAAHIGLQAAGYKLGLALGVTMAV